MNVLILGNPKKDRVGQIGSDIVFFLSARGHNAYAEKVLGLSVPEPTSEKMNFAIVLGGDGTILRKAHEHPGLPILGVNLGRVGVLAQADPENCLDVIEKVLNGASFVEHRAALSAELVRSSGERQAFLAYNEVVLHRASSMKMLNIGIKINSSNDAHFYADGVIVATPTGSSAYCLSGGGPLLIPTSKNIAITPLCPQLRTITSLVVSGEDKIEISLGNGSKPSSPCLEIDGLISTAIQEGDLIRIETAPNTLDIIKTEKNTSLFEPIFKVTNTFSENS